MRTFLVLAAALLLSAGCTADPTTPEFVGSVTPGETPAPSPTDGPGEDECGEPRGVPEVRLVLSECRISRSEFVEMRIENHGPEPLTYAPPFVLQRRSQGEWKTINRRQAFPMPLLGLGPGEVSRWEPVAIYIGSPDALPMRVGRYRVSRAVSIGDPGRERFLTASFRVVAD